MCGGWTWANSCSPRPTVRFGALKSASPRNGRGCRKALIRAYCRRSSGGPVELDRGFVPLTGQKPTASNQPQALQACMPVLADDDVVMHGNAERLCHLNDRLRHLDVRA